MIYSSGQMECRNHNRAERKSRKCSECIIFGVFLPLNMKTNLSFCEVAEQWKENKRGMVKHSTFCAYLLILKSHLLPAFGASTVIQESDVQDFVLEKLHAGLSRKSVHDILAVLKAIAKYGAKHSVFDFPTWEIKFPTDTAVKNLQVLSIPHHKRLLEYISGRPTTQNIGILLALSCGMRIGEVCALRWENVDLIRRVITISGTTGRIYNCEARRMEQYSAPPKTKSSNREIPIPNFLIIALRKVRKLQSGTEYVVGSGAKPKDPRTYRESFTRLLRRLDIPPIVFHGLRHTFATRCIESQCDYKTVSVILGQSNIATTLNLYVHPNLDQKKRCIEKMNKFIGLKAQ